jgi:hypothetical protein
MRPIRNLKDDPKKEDPKKGDKVAEGGDDGVGDRIDTPPEDPKSQQKPPNPARSAMKAS